ncbi:DUF6033 family protein [Agathobacter ruminis]|uniref:Uncharacterized protein n=1 Tax=Agathobacter ruminis TaxID=1712665 RepID=A0A2G3E702_9FIRM|nr:DUF6033 family protein [Agathobacter ruminis]MDC7300967.1 DUF6033 family protein [Agathobacter ruminis]PHU38915.1 hypothetical protein CSX02_00245 [Agathobacter ruminis]
MAMEINSVYGNYASTYTNQKETKQVKTSKPTNEADKTEGQASSVGNTKQNESVRKTAADELTYLKNNHEGFTFVAANYTAATFSPAKRYGSLETTNIAISPDFLKKMANNPELEKQYEDEFENMKRLDEQELQMHEMAGTRLVARGWVVDKDGGIAKWGIGEPTNKRHYGQEMNDYANKVRKEKAEKRKEQEKIAAKKEAATEKKEALEEKRKADKEEQATMKKKIDSDNRELLGDKYKGSEWYDASDDIFAGEAAKGLRDGSVGLNLDMKL